MFDWNDLRHFLAVARAGSTLAASKRLRVSQATVSRRVTVLEEALGFALFVRGPSGYVLSTRGEAMLAVAEEVEATIGRFTGLAEAEMRRLSGSVRITTVEAAVDMWITPAIAGFRKDHPGVFAQISTGDGHLDLNRGDADIAIRFGERPSEDGLVIRHLVDLGGTVYAASTLVEELGLPRDLSDLARYPMVAITSDFGLRTQAWYDEVAPGAHIASGANTLQGVVAALRSGMGTGVLPCVMGDAADGLVRLFPPIPALVTPAWMVTTEAARQQPHVRAMIDFLVRYILGPGRPA